MYYIIMKFNKYLTKKNISILLFLLLLIFVAYLVCKFMNKKEGFTSDVSGCITNSDGKKSCKNPCLDSEQSCSEQNLCMYDSDCNSAPVSDPGPTPEPDKKSKCPNNEYWCVQSSGMGTCVADEASCNKFPDDKYDDYGCNITKGYKYCGPDSFPECQIDCSPGPSPPGPSPPGPSPPGPSPPGPSPPGPSPPGPSMDNPINNQKYKQCASLGLIPIEMECPALPSKKTTGLVDFSSPVNDDESGDAALPTKPGCWYKAPSGCNKYKIQASNSWVLSKTNESTKEKCLNAVEQLNQMCNISNIISYFVPTSTSSSKITSGPPPLITQPET